MTTGRRIYQVHLVGGYSFEVLDHNSDVTGFLRRLARENFVKTTKGSYIATAQILRVDVIGPEEKA